MTALHRLTTTRAHRVKPVSLALACAACSMGLFAHATPPRATPAAAESPTPSQRGADAAVRTVEAAQRDDLALIAVDDELEINGRVARLQRRLTFRNLAARPRVLQMMDVQLALTGPSQTDPMVLAPDADLTVILRQLSTLLAIGTDRQMLTVPRPAGSRRDTLFSLRAQVVADAPLRDVRSTHGARISGEGTPALHIDVPPSATQERRDFRLEFRVDRDGRHG